MERKPPILLLVLFLVIVAGLSFLFLRGFGDGQPSQEVVGEGTFIALVSSPGNTWYSIKDLSNNTPVSVLPEFDGQVVDYATNDFGEALVYDDRGTHVVQVRSSSADSWNVVSRSPFEKRDIVLSKDGNYLAYAELKDRGDSSLLSSWEIYFFDRITGDLFLAGNGYAPHFLVFSSEEDESEMLVFSSLEGLSTVPTVAREEDGLFVQQHEIYFATTIEDVMHFSSRNIPGDTVATAYNPLLSFYEVFSIPSQYFDLEYLGNIEGGNLLGISGSTILATQGSEVYAYVEPGTSISEIFREVGIGDSQSIIEIITSEYE